MHHVINYLPKTRTKYKSFHAKLVPRSKLKAHALDVFHQVTMQDYRNEVQELFSGDEQLAAEVEFALKKAEEERAMQEQMDSCSLTGNTQLPPANVRMWNINITHQRQDISDLFHIKTAVNNFTIVLCPQGPVPGSPIRLRPLLPFKFTTPQPPRPNVVLSRKALTDR